MFNNSGMVANISKTETNVFMRKVYFWMFLALVISGLASFWVLIIPWALEFIFSNTLVFYWLMIAEIWIVIYLSTRITKLSKISAITLFMAYSILTWLTLSVIFLVYAASAIFLSFFIASATFLVMAIYWYTTDTDLTSFWNIMIMWLMWVILASVINFFLKSSGLDFIISWISVLVFTWLTAYDNQKIKLLWASLSEKSDDTTKIAIIWALNLYLDFINLFLSLLRIFGRRN